MALRVAGRGMASHEPGGAPGDLYVVVHARPDPRFRRDGADLWRQETLPVTDAVLGTTLEVPTLEGGKADVKIPAGIQPDTVLRLRNKGLPRFGGKGRGDMYLQVRIRFRRNSAVRARTLRAAARAARQDPAAFLGVGREGIPDPHCRQRMKGLFSTPIVHSGEMLW